MKLRHLKFSTLLSLVFSMNSCLFPICDDEFYEDFPSTVYNEDSFVEISLINGSAVETVSFTDGVVSAENVVDASSFGSEELVSFETGIAAPIDTTVSIEADLQMATINLEDGTQIPPFFAGVGSSGIIVADDEIEREDFRYNFTYPSDATPIPIDSISSIVLIYSLNYFSFDGLLHTKIFTHTVVFN
ncbi:hypothetical protein [Gilvibacter sediminis]|uniref:hypothetical protein n=1 Tax=Gilvibacter sediminis TaxID=379071 RepID=UPI0023506B2F|nr:hypothetical protein [Gilvibacter sediminis]MDC7996551.1 hypothetical protein [Gilvibacter sediminis]